MGFFSSQVNCYCIIDAFYIQWHLRFEELWQVLSCVSVLMGGWRLSRVWEERSLPLCPVAMGKNDKLRCQHAHMRAWDPHRWTFTTSYHVFESKRRNTCHVFNYKLKDIIHMEHFLGTRLEACLYSHIFVTLVFLNNFLRYQFNYKNSTWLLWNKDIEIFEIWKFHYMNVTVNGHVHCLYLFSIVNQHACLYVCIYVHAHTHTQLYIYRIHFKNKSNSG